MMFRHVNSFQMLPGVSVFKLRSPSAGALLFPLAQLASTASTPLVLSFRLPYAEHKVRTLSEHLGTYSNSPKEPLPPPQVPPPPRQSKTYQDAFDLLQLSHEFGILCSLSQGLSNGFTGMNSIQYDSMIFNGFTGTFLLDTERCDMMRLCIQHTSTDRFQRTQPI